MLTVGRSLSSRKAVRDCAILRLLHDLGSGRGELVALDMSDADLTTGTLHVLGKGKLQKEPLTLPAPTRDALNAWIDVRGTEPGPLFLNGDRAGQGDGRLTGTVVYKVVRSLGQAVGVETKPHGIGRLGITEAVRTAQQAGYGI